jgi:tRNA1(Val) A37 N6-methylase TrmN6
VTLPADQDQLPAWPITNGSLLGGRVSYAQPTRGFRTGIEPVLLAASIPAAPGDRILEAGTGAAAGLLCLMARVPGLVGLGIERDPVMAALARQNLDANGQAQTGIDMADITAWCSGVRYRHAFANPPWHRGGTGSPEPLRAGAKHAGPGLLQAWAASLARTLERRGTLSFIVPAGAVGEAVAAMRGAHCGEVTLIPLWPHAGEAARLAIVRGVREGRGGTTLHPGLVLHEKDGAYTLPAEAILRQGQALV